MPAMTQEKIADSVRSFVAEHHENLDGWFYPLDMVTFVELYNLQKALKLSGNIAEVGVWKGKSLTLLSLLRTREESLLCFDSFDDDNRRITEKNVQAYGNSENIKFWKGFTSDLSVNELDRQFETPLRFLHIDAGHEYHEVLEQLHLLSPYVSDSGIIAMDDYQDAEFPGVGAAVLDFAEKVRPRRFVPFLATGNKMYLCTRENASLFQELMIQKDVFRDGGRLTRVRDFNILIIRSRVPVETQVIIKQIHATFFPKHDDELLTLREKAKRYSQITFGKGKASGQ